MVADDGLNKAIITDVTLREYGQNVSANYLHIFNPEIRVEIALSLIDTGFTNIEILSCVNPQVAPAMNKETIRKIAENLGRFNGVNLITLVPNEVGYKGFLSAGLGPDGYNHSMGLFFSAVEAHNLANLGRPIRETIEEYEIILKDASSRGVRVIGYISAAFGYAEPENGVLYKPDIDEINAYIDLLIDRGVDAVTLSDLQGVADQQETREFFDALLNRRKGRYIEKLGYHPHHVDGDQAIASSKIAYGLGIRRFDSSLGGTGGCVTGAPGNQPTEQLVLALHSLGIETGIDEQKVLFLANMVQNELYSKIPLNQASSQHSPLSGQQEEKNTE
jgi:hydroxymethylglutaryl-CoA lyase